MLHLVFCPNCGENVKVHCENVPNPFQYIHSDNVARIINTIEQTPNLKPPPQQTQSILKLMFLLDMIGDHLPPLDELPKLPPIVEDYIDHADIAKTKHILIQAVGRWDTLGERITPN